MKQICKYTLILLLIGVLPSCDDMKSNQNVQVQVKKRFTLLPPDSTGVYFANTMVEDETVMLTFEHRFNGAGVGIGDVNNDGLDDLFFTATNLDNKLYLNLGSLKFKDITAEAGILKSDGIATGVTMVDINCDGYLDIYICRTGKSSPDKRQNLLYINNRDLTFRESALEYGLADQGYSNQATFFDFDNDGDLDMYLVNQPIEYTYANTILLRSDTVRQYVSDRFYRNNGDQTFTEITKQAGLVNKAFGFNAAVEDFNNDRYWDLYVTNDYLQPDYLYINNGNGTFTESLSSYMKHCPNSSMGSVIADYNNDGLSDVFVLDMVAEDNHRQKLLRGPMDYDDFYLSSANGAYYQYMRNQLQLNNGNGTFSEIGELAGVSNTDWSWGPLMADFDNDGWKDLFIANGYRRDLTNMDYVVYFLDSINKLGGVSIFRSMADMLSSLPETPVQNYMFRNKKDLTFQNVSDDWGFSAKTFSNGSACADLDNDGDLDIVVNNIDQPAMIYRNETSSIDSASFLTVKVNGDTYNTHGIGTKVRVVSGENVQVNTYFPTSGFFSCLPNKMLFGLSLSSTVDTLEVIWPENKRLIRTNIRSNQQITADIKDAISYTPSASKPEPIFLDVTKSSGLNFKHQENDFVDFKREPLLPMKFSELGPALAIGDINGDGLSDVYIGGAKDHPGVLYTMGKDSKFRKKGVKIFEDDKLQEDVGAAFFDADQDGDLDLYVSSGGNEWDAGMPVYQDRLYVNDGVGNFKKGIGILPPIDYSTSCVVPGDFDGDGDFDLFIGGRIIAWNYPVSPRSYLLLNEAGKFRDATAELAPELVAPGLVCDAAWADLNGDGTNDLIVVGQWMYPMVLLNKSGKLKKASEDLTTKSGWWNCVEVADMDGDGDMDFILGNRGLNSRISASENEPARVYAKDFDKNGTLDAIMTYYIQGKSFPIHSRDVLSDQIRPLKKKFLRYRDYADATIYDIYSGPAINESLILEAKTFASFYVENKGDNNFSFHELPLQAQFSTINDIVTGDWNNDGKKDILFVGNDYSPDVETGRYDASIGGVLLGNGSGSFTFWQSQSNGLNVSGNVRHIQKVASDSGTLLIIAKNNEPVQVLKFRENSVTP